MPQGEGIIVTKNLLCACKNSINSVGAALYGKYVISLCRREMVSQDHCCHQMQTGGHLVASKAVMHTHTHTHTHTHIHKG